MRQEILILINSLQGGGAEKVSITFANKLLKLGYNVKFAVLNLLDSVHHGLLDKNIEFFNLQVAHARGSFFAFREFLKKENPDNILVFNHELAVMLVIQRFLRKKKYKIIARNINTLSLNRKYETSFWHKHIKDIFIRFFYNYVDLIIAQSEMMRNDLVEHYRISADKCVIINNPVSGPFEEKFKDYKFISDKKDEILFVGRLEKQKGLHYLLDAFRDVLAKKPHIKLRIIGQGTLKTKLIDYSASIGIKKSVIFKEFTKDIIPYYRNSKVTVLSSLFEGFPNVLVESIYCGTPVVSFDCKSGPAEIIEDGVNGFLVEHLNIKQLTEKLIEALHYKWDQQKIHQSAKRFESDIIVENYLQAISQVIK